MKQADNTECQAFSFFPHLRKDREIIIKQQENNITCFQQKPN